MEDFFQDYESAPTHPQTTQYTEFTGFQSQTVHQQIPNQNVINTQHMQQQPISFQSNFNTYQINNQQQQIAQQDNNVVQQQQLDIEYKLRQKASQQYQLKKQRKANGAKVLQQFLEQRDRTQVKTKLLHREKQNELQELNKDKNYKNSWAKIVDNIALKDGQYPGIKDVGRMKEAIVNKKSDELKN